MTLCCGILTIETSHSFLRSFCFTGQNGAFSTTEQNHYLFIMDFSEIPFSQRPTSQILNIMSSKASTLPKSGECYLFNHRCYILLCHFLIRQIDTSIIFELNILHSLPRSCRNHKLCHRLCLPFFIVINRCGNFSFLNRF